MILVYFFQHGVRGEFLRLFVTPLPESAMPNGQK